MKTYFLTEDDKIYVYKEPGDGSIWVAQPVTFQWRKVAEGSVCAPTFKVDKKK